MWTSTVASHAEAHPILAGAEAVGIMTCVAIAGFIHAMRQWNTYPVPTPEHGRAELIHKNMTVHLWP